MKKSRIFMQAFALVSVAVLLFSCGDDPEVVTPTPEPPTPPVEETMPTISLEAVSMTIDRLSFTLASTDAEDVYWVFIKKGSREVSISDVVKNGTPVEPNKTHNLEATGLEDNTTYEIYAVASNSVGDKMEMLEMTTLEDVPPVQTLRHNVESAAVQMVYDNFEGFVAYYIYFYDAQGNYFAARFGAPTEPAYLASGTYTRGDDLALNGLDYTTYMTTDAEASVLLVSGQIEVVATPNEADYTVVYTFSGELMFENGDTLLLSYDGEVEGLSIPKPVEPEPTDGREFVVDNETSQTYRDTLNDEVPGQYTIKFTDKDWSVLILDILVDPATCNYGKDPLPAGTYSIATETMTTYSQATFYSAPYWDFYFSECEVKVSVEGDEYTFEMEALGDGDKRVRMNYTGTVKDMVRE